VHRRPELLHELIAQLHQSDPAQHQAIYKKHRSTILETGEAYGWGA
jgi:hypothetical protein